MSKAYKTEAVARQQASKKHGKNWEENWSILETDEGFEIVAKLVEDQAVEDQAVEDQAHELEVLETEEPENQAPSMLSGLVNGMLNPETVPSVPVPPKKEAEKTGKTIEPNRPEQNGLKRPSKGSTCCIIWDTCDKITAQKESTCTSAELFNALQGYNECTLRTQYARWRQFNGVVGRLPGQNKTAKLPAAFDDAKDVLLLRVTNESAQATLEAVTTAVDLIQWIASNSENF